MGKGHMLRLCIPSSKRLVSTSSIQIVARRSLSSVAAVETGTLGWDAGLPPPPKPSQWPRSPPSQRKLELQSRKTVKSRTSGELLHDVLIAQKVDHIFGYPGGAKVPVFEQALTSGRFTTTIAQHEQGMGHMAEGYTRAIGKPGIVFVTAGSGLTNLVTPMQDALSDGTAMVVLCSPGSEWAEDVDVGSIAMACSKWNAAVTRIEDLPRIVNEAFTVATNGRPGPVLVQIPRALNADRTTQISTTTYSPQRPALHPDKLHDFNRSSFHRIAKLIKIAKRPVLYVGQGMLTHPEGSSILKEFARKAAIPVTTSLHGLGAFDERDPKTLGMLGLHGTPYANMTIQEADLIITLGARFDDRVTGNIAKFAPKALEAAAEGRGGIVQFEIAPKNVNKVVEVVASVQGDCATNLAHLTPLVAEVADRPEWFRQIQQWKMKFPLSTYNRIPTSPPGQIKTQEVIEKLSDMTEHMKDRTLISTGVGQHQMWTAQHFRWRFPRTMLTSGGLGTMGYGLPAAIGAKLARPDCLVVDIDGDASFNMSISELLTAARNNIAVKVLLFNNEQMGMISDLQRHYYSSKFTQNRQTNPDFVKTSEALGVAALRCSKPDEIETSLRWLLDHDGPAVLEVMTEQSSSVWPVVPSGKGLHEFITYPEQ